MLKFQRKRNNKLSLEWNPIVRPVTVLVRPLNEDLLSLSVYGSKSQVTFQEKMKVNGLA